MGGSGRVIPHGETMDPEVLYLNHVQTNRSHIVVVWEDSTGKQQTLMKTLLKRFLVLSLATGLFALLSTGCQTTKGLGEDVEDLGEAIQGK